MIILVLDIICDMVLDVVFRVVLSSECMWYGLVWSYTVSVV